MEYVKGDWVDANMKLTGAVSDSGAGTASRGARRTDLTSQMYGKTDICATESDMLC